MSVLNKIALLVCMLTLIGGICHGQEKADTLQEAVLIDWRHTKSSQSASQTGHKRIDKLEIINGSMFLSTPDIIKSIQNLPGVASGTELMSGLYVHGGDGSDNLFLLDGVPLYQVTHVGGMFSSFNTDIVKNLDFYKSGFPARYGGRLSSVVEVRTEEGDFEEFHGNVSIGLIDGRLKLTGPIVKGKTSFSIAARRSWLSTVMVPMVKMLNKRNHAKGNPDSFDGRYNFHDINFNITHRLSNTDKLYFRVYNGRDRLKLSNEDHETEIISMINAQLEKVTLSNLEDDLRWGNTAVSLEWDKRISDGLSSSVSAWWTSSRADIDYVLDHTEKIDSELSDEFHTSENNRSLINDFGIRGDFYWKPSEKHFIRFGGAVQHHGYAPQRQWNFIKESLEHYGESSDRYTGDEAGLYLEDEISIGSRLMINAGLRYAAFMVPEKTWHRLEPRVALNLKITDGIEAKASYSEMNQFAHLVTTSYLDLPTNCWMPSTAIVPPSHSKQYAGGIYSRLPHNITFNLEGYYKTMDNLLEYGGVNTLFPPLDSWEYDFHKGKGKAYGMEVEAGWKGGGTSLTAYYTLSWSLRKFDAIYHSWYPDRNDNRHKFTIMGTQKLGKGVELYATWNWRSGNRMTVESHIYESTKGNLVYYSSPNNIQLPNYHRLDLGANFERTTKRGNESVWNVSIYNVYCKKNAVFATIEIQEDGSYKGSGKAIFPIIPSFSYTFRF